VIVVDTSGSIGSDELNQFAAEMTAILREHQTSCTVIYCDAEVAGVEEFTSEDLPLILNPKGGGGTDFRPPFEWVDEKGLQPSCMIYLTDLEGTFPEQAPAYPTLWGIIGKSQITPPFGEEVQL
jgi:predicted metal-dependent peptidase